MGKKVSLDDFVARVKRKGGDGAPTAPAQLAKSLKLDVDPRTLSSLIDRGVQAELLVVERPNGCLHAPPRVYAVAR